MGDLPYFFAGRHDRPRAVVRLPSLRSEKGRLHKLMHKLMQKHHVLFVLYLRFLYGLRIAGLLALGMSKMSAARFLLLDFIGAIVESVGVYTAGYSAGRFIQKIFDKGITPGLFTLFVAILAGKVLLRTSRRRAATASPD